MGLSDTYPLLISCAWIVCSLVGCNDSSSEESQFPEKPDSSDHSESAKAAASAPAPESAPNASAEPGTPPRTNLPVAQGFAPYVPDTSPLCMLVYGDDGWSFYDGPFELIAPGRSPLPGQDALLEALEKARMRTEQKGIQGEVFLFAPAELPAAKILEMHLGCLQAGFRNVAVMVRNETGEEAALGIPLGPSVALDSGPIIIEISGTGEVSTGVGSKKIVVSTSLDDRRLEGLDQPLEDYLSGLQAKNDKFSSAYIRTTDATHQRLVDVLVRLQAYSIVDLHPNDEGFSVEETEPEPDPQLVRPPIPHRITPPPVRPRQRP